MDRVSGHVAEKGCSRNSRFTPSALQDSYPWFVHRDMFGTRSHIGQPIREPRFHQYVMLLW
jgi:hypothetical protein